MSQLKELYNNEIKKNLMTKFNYKSIMEVPKLNKIVINIGVGDGSHDSKFVEAALKDLELITEYFRYWIYDTNNPIDDSGITDRIKCLLGRRGKCYTTYCVGKWIVILPNGDITHCGYVNKENIFCNIRDINSFEELIQITQSALKESVTLVKKHLLSVNFFNLWFNSSFVCSSKVSSLKIIAILFPMILVCFPYEVSPQIFLLLSIINEQRYL